MIKFLTKCSCLYMFLSIYEISNLISTRGIVMGVANGISHITRSKCKCFGCCCLVVSFKLAQHCNCSSSGLLSSNYYTAHCAREFNVICRLLIDDVISHRNTSKTKQFPFKKSFENVVLLFSTIQ